MGYGVVCFSQSKSDLQKNSDPRWALLSDSVQNRIARNDTPIHFMPPYLSPTHTETFSDEDYEIICQTIVDTTEVMVNFHKYNGELNALIGYNHLYNFIITDKTNSKKISFTISKKTDLTNLDKGCCWTLSNLNPWSYISFNKKYHKFIFTYNVNPLHNYGDNYYYILNKDGSIHFQGFDKAWGGGGPDGKVHVLKDFVVSSNEIYSFQENTKVSLTDLSKLKDFYVYAMRVLNDSAILVIFEKNISTYDEHGNMKSSFSTAENKENAMIVSVKGKTLKRFNFHDLFEEMDAIFRVNEHFTKDSLLYVDSRRDMLGIIDKYPPYNISEIRISEMKLVPDDLTSELKGMKLLFRVKNHMVNYEIWNSNQGGFYLKK